MKSLLLVALPTLCWAQSGIIGPAVFTGSGLNDATSGGSVTGTTGNFTITVIIDNAGAPNKFKWQFNSGSFTTGVSITGATQTLARGVTIRFAATTGHTLNDKWVITETAHGSLNTSSFISTGTGATFRSAELKAREHPSVLDFGAFCDGSHDDKSAFVAAFSGTLGASLFVPSGTCVIDNSAGPLLITNWGGLFWGKSDSILSCTDLSKQCLTFSSPTNLKLDTITVTFGPMRTVRGGINFTIYIVEGTNVILDSVKSYNSNNSGVVIQQCDNVQITNMYVYDHLANGLFFTNSTHVMINGLYCNNDQDACLEASGYDPFAGVPAGVCQYLTATNVVSINSFLGILFNSCMDMTVDGFNIYGGYNGGIAVYQDPGTTHTKWPTRITISNGTIDHIGYLASVNPFAYGIYMNQDETPAFPMEIVIANVTIHDTLYDGMTIGVEGMGFNKTNINLGLSNVIVDTTGGSGAVGGGGMCYRIGTKGTVQFSNIQARNCNNRALEIGPFNSPVQVSGSGLYVYNARGDNASMPGTDPTVIFANVASTDNVVISNLFVEDTRNPALGYTVGDSGAAPVLISNIHPRIPFGTFQGNSGSNKSFYTRADFTTPVNTFVSRQAKSPMDVFGHAASKITAGEPVTAGGAFPEVEFGFEFGAAGTGATVTGTLMGGALTMATVTSGGSDYAAGQTCIVISGTGSITAGAAAHAVVGGGLVNSVVVDNPGAGYTTITLTVTNCGYGWIQSTLAGVVNTNLLINANGGRILMGSGGLPSPPEADDGVTAVQISGGGLKVGDTVTAVQGFKYGPTPTPGYTGLVGCGFTAGGGIVTSPSGGVCTIPPFTFIGLPTPAGGVYSMIRCTNCAVSTPCKSGGSGAFAFSDGTRWNCPFR